MEDRKGTAPAWRRLHVMHVLGGFALLLTLLALDAHLAASVERLQSALSMSLTPPIQDEAKPRINLAPPLPAPMEDYSVTLEAPAAGPR